MSLRGMLMFGLLFPPALSAQSSAVDSSLWTSLKGLRIHYQMDTVELERDAKHGNAWMVKGLGLPADSVRVKAAWRMLSSLKGGDVAVIPTPSLEDIGLDEAEAHTVDVRLPAGKSVRLRLGHPAMDPVTTYWTRDGSKNLHQAKSRAWSVAAEKEYWLERKMLPSLNINAVRTLRVTWNDSAGVGRGYELRRLADGNMRLFGPDSQSHWTVKAGSVLFLTRDFLIDALPEAGEKPRSAAAAAVEMSVRLELADGKVHVLEARGGSKDFYYVRHPVHGTLVQIRRSRLDAFKRDLKDLTEMPAQGPVPDFLNEHAWRPPLLNSCPIHGEEEEITPSEDWLLPVN